MWNRMEENAEMPSPAQTPYRFQVCVSQQVSSGLTSPPEDPVYSKRPLHSAATNTKTWDPP